LPRKTACALCGLTLVLLLAPALAAQQARPWVPELLGAQFTLIGQTLRPLSSPYRGPNSLDPAGATQATHSYGVYGGMALTRWLQAYLDGEMALGQGVGTGLGGLSAEQPISDGGETGVFVRAGWNDGRTEDFCFTEVDRHLSAGLQATGARWRRREDRVGLALVRHGLSPDHARYLEAGGSGFLLGDGRLDYGHELIAELYYRLQVGSLVELSPDVQRVWNPGYNRDRGPATVLSLRLNARY
jgi:hypothetical protein